MWKTTHRFDDECPLSEVSADDEAGQNRLDLRDSRAASVRSERVNEHSSYSGERHAPENVEDALKNGGQPALVGQFQAEHFGPFVPLGGEDESIGSS